MTTEELMLDFDEPLSRFQLFVTFGEVPHGADFAGRDARSLQLPHGLFGILFRGPRIDRAVDYIPMLSSPFYGGEAGVTGKRVKASCVAETLPRSLVMASDRQPFVIDTVIDIVGDIVTECVLIPLGMRFASVAQQIGEGGTNQIRADF